MNDDEALADLAAAAQRRYRVTETLRRLLSIHHTATPRHAICVSCGQRFPCQSRELLEDLEDALGALVHR